MSKGQPPNVAIAAIKEGLRAFPHLRVGQLIENALGPFDGRDVRAVFYISDADMATRIYEFIKWCGK